MTGRQAGHEWAMTGGEGEKGTGVSGVVGIGEPIPC